MRKLTARHLWWELTKHVLHRRGRDEVFVAIQGDGWLTTAAVTDFRWESDADAFCTIDGDAEVDAYANDIPVIPGVPS